jgi:hypothetical protein
MNPQIRALLDLILSRCSDPLRVLDALKLALGELA